MVTSAILMEDVMQEWQIGQQKNHQGPLLNHSSLFKGQQRKKQEKFAANL